MNENNSEHGTHHAEKPHGEHTTEVHHTPTHEPVHHVSAHTPSEENNKGGLNMWMVATLILAGVIVGYGASNFAGFSKEPVAEVKTVNAEDDQKQPDAAPAAPAAIITEEQMKALPEDDPFFGKADAPVTIVEFSDFQCIFCDGFYKESLPGITKDFIDTGKVKLVYRDYPLSIHPQAVGASHAAECADDQKKFKEMHDILFEKQKEWSGKENALEIFAGYAKTIGLDEKAYGDCMTGQKNLQEIRKDMLDGIAVGVRGTPHLFINDHRISGAMDYEKVFKPAIQAEVDGKEWKLAVDPLTNEPFIELL